MRSALLSIAAGVALAAVSPLLADEQNLEVTINGSDKCLHWYGHAGRTYFIQVSDPDDHLRTWTWAPVIETGNNTDISHEVGGTADKGFFLLWFSDQPTTDPDGDDFDYDYLTNWEEVSIYQTNPLDDDSDGDGIWDDYEIFGYNGYTTNPNSLDTDGDGLSDGDEINLYFSDPTFTDVDSDGDSLLDLIELWLGLNPATTDSNNNGITDDLEDADRDLLSNIAEVSVHLTNAKRFDTDLDTLNDGWEVANGFNPRVHNLTDGDPSNDPGADPDNDGLTNSEEETIGTKAKNPDSDGDGVDDKTERDQGSNPNDPNDSAPPPTGTTSVNVTFGDDSGSHSEKYRVQLTPLEGDNTGHTKRSRTNRGYGVSQTDTFQLPKGAKYRVELLHIDTNRSDGVPDYDHTLEIDTSQGCLVVDDPENTMGTSPESGGTVFVIEGKSATLYVPLFKPLEVSFSNSTIPGWLTSDDTIVTYDAPHWQDDNDDGDADDPGERRYPIAYVQNTPPSIAGTIKVKPSGLTAVSGFSAKIKVTGPGNIKIDGTAATIGTDEIMLPATPSSGNFAQEIDYLNPMTLSWKVEVNDKGHWCEAGETSTKTYVTFGTPATSMRQETLFDIGCRNADGQSVEDLARDAMFGEFTDQTVTRLDGVQMTYWKNDQMGCTDTPDLLKRPDGNGNCQSWGGLFRDILRTHGIAADRIKVWPKNNDTLLIVKKWSFTNHTSGPPNHPYREGVDVTNLSGIEGQGNPDPPGYFNGHWITKSGGFYYDPSYGTQPVTQANVDKNYEDGAFAGFGAVYGSGATSFIGIRKNSTAAPSAEVDYFLAN